MGLGGMLFSAGSYEPPNPKPWRFTIREHWQIGEYAVLTIHYPDCTTHGGDKVLVYHGTLADIQKRTHIDPHFLEDDKSPIARFPATPEGKEDALVFARAKSMQGVRVVV